MPTSSPSKGNAGARSGSSRPGGNRPGGSRPGDGASHARAAKARLEQERKRRQQIVFAGIASVIVVAVVVTLVAVKLAGGKSSTTVASNAPAVLAPGDVVSTLANIPAAQLADGAKTNAASAPHPITGQPALTAAGGASSKVPQIVYVGAEYCPYCAAERWAVVTALSKFGTFTGLGQTHSATNDTDPNTPTFSFHGASYSSPAVSFAPVEEQDTNGAKLDAPSALQTTLVGTYDKAPYTGASSGSSAGGIPFIDLGNKFIVSGASFDPALLAGKSMEQVAAAAADPSTKIGQAVQSAAGKLVADICSLTGGQPTNVCSAFSGT
ncbi:MAG TPA: DUF929 family protein [Acidimicrobiales bacterium]